MAVVQLRDDRSLDIYVLVGVVRGNLALSTLEVEPREFLDRLSKTYKRKKETKDKKKIRCHVFFTSQLNDDFAIRDGEVDGASFMMLVTFHI